MKKFLLACFCFLLYMSSFAQVNPLAQKWVDSVFNSLTDDQRIAQLMVLRVSAIGSKGVTFYDQQVNEMITKYNIGGVCLFQGGPVKQANIVNNFQKIAQTPVLVCIDAEWGLGMRYDSVKALNHQLMLGAMEDGSIVYQYGRLVGQQLKRAGIQVNYAPVVDINNNPNNPVINDRSFGEDKYKVALFGVQYMKGMQDVGVMATAKHFPGHGDVAVDSHLDLPVISKTKEQLDSLELYPFKEMFKAGVGSVMVAHLYIPAIDNRPYRATSISKSNVTDLLRNELGFQGLTFTDALNMQGVAKYFPGGEISVESVIAGNDMLCLPSDVPGSITMIREAIKQKKLTWEDIYSKTRKILMAKYQYKLYRVIPVQTSNLANDLNDGINDMKKLVAENAITLLNKQPDTWFFPLAMPNNKAGKSEKNVAYIAIGSSSDNAMTKRMRSDYNADVFYFNYKQDALRILSTVELIKKRYRSVVIGVHGYARYPANNFGISKAAVELVRQLQEQTKSIVFVFGNPYAIKNFCDAKNLVACYEDDDITQNVAADFLEGKASAKGKLPVTVCDNYKYGAGIVMSKMKLPTVNPEEVAIDPAGISAIDSIANDAIEKGAFPGCVVLVARNGKIAYEKAFGNNNYYENSPVSINTIFDMASVTKICATTISVMKLYDEGKLDLKKTLGDYLPWVRGSDKAGLLIEDVLLHQAGLVSYIPFFKETIDSVTKLPLPAYYSPVQTPSFNIRVAEGLFMRNDWRDTLYARILQSTLGKPNKYIYSDNDFIFLGKIVEAISGLPLDEYAKKNFYDPMGLSSTGFRPRERFVLNRIAPTENEKLFRFQHLVGDVHDPGSAMFGGVAGHAGLFSTVNDLALILQMLLDGGVVNGRKYLEPGTIKLFTSYNSGISRRGFGFDKPEKDNEVRPDPYPAKSVSPLTFGHTGYTGTCIWVDPKYNLVFVFLSNRVNPDGGENTKILKMNVRGKIQETIYKSILN